MGSITEGVVAGLQIRQRRDEFAAAQRDQELDRQRQIDQFAQQMALRKSEFEAAQREQALDNQRQVEQFAQQMAMRKSEVEAEQAAKDFARAQSMRQHYETDLDRLTGDRASTIKDYFTASEAVRQAQLALATAAPLRGLQGDPSYDLAVMGLKEAMAAQEAIRGIATDQSDRINAVRSSLNQLSMLTPPMDAGGTTAGSDGARLGRGTASSGAAPGATGGAGPAATPGEAEDAGAILAAQTDPLQQAVDYAASLGFSDVKSDGKSFTVTTDSKDEADRASKALKVLEHSPALAGRFKVVDRSAELEKHYNEAFKFEASRSRAIALLSRYEGAMLPTADQSMIMDFATQATMASEAAIARGEDGSAEAEQARQLNSMAGLDVETRKKAFAPFAQLAREQVESMNKDVETARNARRAYMATWGTSGLLDKQEPPPQGTAGEPTASPSGPPAGMKDDEALQWWLKENGHSSFSVMNDPKLAVAYSKWLAEYKKKK